MRNITTHYPFHNDFNTSKNKTFTERLKEQAEGPSNGPIEYTGTGSKESYDSVTIRGIKLDGSFLV